MWDAPADTSGITAYAITLDRNSDSIPATTDKVQAGTVRDVTLPVAADGIWWLHVRARDAAGNWSGSAAHLHFTADVTGPTLTITSSTHPDQDQAYSRTHGEFAFVSNEPIEGYSVLVDHNPMTDLPLGYTTTEPNWTVNLPDGVWYLHVRALDKAYNRSANVHYRFVIDSTGPAKPVLTSTSHPDQESVYPDRTFVGTAAATDSDVVGWSVIADHSADTTPAYTVSQTTGAISISDLPDGESWVHVAAVDAAGNWSLPSHMRVRVDAAGPGAPVDLESWSHPIGDVPFLGREVDARWQPPLDANPAAAYALSYDHNPDTLPATIGYVQDGSETHAALTVPSDGTWYIHVRAKDTLGRWSATAAHLRVMVVEKPTTNVTGLASTTHPDQNAAYQPGAFEGTWDAADGADGYSVSVDNSAFTMPDETTDTTDTRWSTNVGDGTWYLHVRAHNAAGWGFPAHYRFTVDTTAPQRITITSATHPNESTFFPNRDFTGTVTAEDNQPTAAHTPVKPGSGIAELIVTGAGFSSTSAMVNGKVTATVSGLGLSDGYHELTVVAKDKAGNTSSPSTRTVWIDATAPGQVHDLTSPSHPDPSRHYSSRTITATWSPPVEIGAGVATYAVVVDQYETTMPGSTSTSVAAASPTLTQTVNADGTWWVHVRARDTLGKWSKLVAHLKVNVDTSAPTRPQITSATHPEEGESYPATDFAAQWSAPGAVGYSYLVNADPDTVPDQQVDTEQPELATTLLDGVWYLHVRSVDRAGNWGPTAHFSIRVGAAAPGNPAPKAPLMDSGLVGTVDVDEHLSQSNGIAMVDHQLYTADDTRIVRVDQSTGAITPIAGIAGDSRCVDATTGADARFQTGDQSVRVVGADTEFLYVADGCGLRRVAVADGATVTLSTEAHRWVAVTGTDLYSVGADNSLYRLSLATGTRTFVATVNPAPIAADATAVWQYTPQGLTKIDIVSGAQSTVAADDARYPDGTATALLSVGDSIYVAVNPLDDTNASLIRIRKNTGQPTMVAGGAATGDQAIYHVSGLAADGAQLVVGGGRPVEQPAGRGVTTYSIYQEHVTINIIHPIVRNPWLLVTPSEFDVEWGQVTTLRTTTPEIRGLVRFSDDFSFTADDGSVLLVRNDSSPDSLFKPSFKLLSGFEPRPCQDSGDPRQVGFGFAGGGQVTNKVIGFDGTYVYVAGPCGLRRVHGSTGMTVTLSTAQYDQGTVADHFIYLHKFGADKVERYDLTMAMAGGPDRQLPAVAGQPYTVSGQYLWQTGGGTNPQLLRTDIDTGSTTSVGQLVWNNPVEDPPGVGITGARGLDASGGSIAVRGDHVYIGATFVADIRSPFRVGPAPMLANPPTTVTGNGALLRYDLSDYSTHLIAGKDHGDLAAELRDGTGDAAVLGKISAITSDGSDLLIIDDSHRFQRVRDAVPAIGTEPALARAWWDRISDEHRAWATDNYTETVGWLDGLPIEARDKANYRMMLDYLNKLIAQGQASSEKAEGIRAFINKYKGSPSLNLGRYFLMGFDGDDDGEMIVAVNNPDTADNITTYVPGTGAAIKPGFVNDDLHRADLMVDDASGMPNGRNTSVIAWLDYDAPNDPVWNSPSEFYAVNAVNEGRLQRFQRGLRVTNHNSHNTILGHSYGTIVIGYVARTPSGLDADEAIFVASPGVGVDHADELNRIPHGHVWAETRAFDAVRGVAGVKYGRMPVNPEFGARRFAFDMRPTTPIAAHSSYWDTASTDSRRSISAIITGAYAGQPETVAWWPLAFEYPNPWKPNLLP